MEGFQFETEIKDGMSGPAKAEVAALDSLESAAHRAEKAVHSLGAETEHAGKLSGEAKGFLKEFTGSLVPEIALGEVAAESIKKVGEAIYEVGERLVDFGIEGVKFSLEAAEFRENMSAAFSIVSGTADEGEKTYAAIERIASSQHLSIAKSGALAKELALSGVENVEALSASVSAIGALQRVGLEQGAEKVTRIIEQSEALGHLQLPKRLAGTGLNVEGLTASLAARLHETPEAIKRELQQGKINADVGIAAIVDSINSGKVGQLAAKKFDLKDVATDWHNVWQQLTEDVDSGPLTTSLRNFVSIFQDGSGSAASLKDEIVTDVNGIIRWLGALVDAGETMALRLELGFLEGKLAAKPMLDEMARVGIYTPSMFELGTAAQTLARYMTEAAVAAAYLVFEVQRVQGWLGGAGAAALHAGGQSSAEGFVGGLVDGLTGGHARVIGEIESLGRDAVNALRRVWDSHSPSRVAFDIGAGIPEGMALGADSGSDRAASALGDALSPPDFSHGIGGGSRSYTIASGAVQITVSGGSLDEETIHRVVTNALTDVLEQTVEELGG